MSCCLRKAWSSGWVMLSKLCPYKSDWGERKTQKEEEEDVWELGMMYNVASSKKINFWSMSREAFSHECSRGRKTIKYLRSNTWLAEKKKIPPRMIFIFCATDSSANTGSWCCCALCLYQGTQGPLDLNSPCSGRGTAPRCSRWAQCCRGTSPWAEMCRGASWDPRWTWGWSGSGWTFPCRILQRKVVD